MRALLLFLSSLAVWTLHAEIPTVYTATGEASDSVEQREFVVDMGKAHLTGIMLTRVTDDEITGSLMNEFGISAVSFIYNRKTDKLKLVEVASFLNKWYIKNVLKNDLKHCIHNLYGIDCDKENGYILELSENLVKLTNRKRNISYTFTPLQQEEELMEQEEGLVHHGEEPAEDIQNEDETKE